MITYYCPNCWTTVNQDQKFCPQCGFSLESFESLSYEDKLLAALHHAVPERRIMAAQILGNRKSQRALPEFEKFIENNEEDYFFLRAVLLAVAKIDHPDRERLLLMATHHASGLVSKLAIELIGTLNSKQQTSRWDRHTG